MTMTPDDEMVRAIHEGGLALAKVHQTVSGAQKADIPLSLNKRQQKALERVRKLSVQIVAQAEILPLPERRSRG